MLVEKVKLGILDACVCKNTKEKYTLKIKHFLRKIAFARTLTSFPFRCRIVKC